MNQFRILEKLDKEDATLNRKYRRYQEILKSGFIRKYPRLYAGLIHEIFSKIGPEPEARLKAERRRASEDLWYLSLRTFGLFLDVGRYNDIGSAVASSLTSSGLKDLLPGPGEWTEADYFPLSERGRLVELSDGAIEVTDLPTDFHQLILLRLSFALHAFVSAGKLGQVRFAPLPVRLWPGKIREPDLVYMSATHADRIGTFWGVPDLAVEILSEGTGRKDREIKRSEYAMAGVSEYWIVDPEARTIELLRLNVSAGSCNTVAVYRVEDHLTSELFPGFSIGLAGLFAEAN